MQRMKTYLPILILSLALTAACKGKSEDSHIWTEKKGVPRVSSSTVITATTFVDLAEKEKPTVVNLSMTKVIKGHPRTFDWPFGGRRRSPFNDFFHRFFGDEDNEEIAPNITQKSLGSGFIISKDGYILTNNHVVEGVDEISVSLATGKELKAKVVGVDTRTDIALIKIDSWKDLPIAELGDSDKVRVGEWVLAIGNPFGLEHTVTQGIISAKGRVIGAGPYDDFLQTDASINPGNSGGPLFNLNGEVVGINTAIIQEGQGIGFAIPINMAKNVIDSLKHKGKVERGWVGVSIQEVTPEIAQSLGLKEPMGALVGEIIPGSPAEKAGIQRGDVIIAFNGEKIKKFSELSRLAAQAEPKKKATVQILRDGAEKTLTLEVGLLPSEKELVEAARNDGKRDKNLGLRVEGNTPRLRDYFGIREAEGVIITDIEAGTPADKAKLQPGDVILEVNRKKVNDLESYSTAISSVKQNSPILLLVLHDSSTHYTTLITNP